MVQDDKKGSGNSSGSSPKSTAKPFPAGVVDQPRKTSDEDLPHIPTFIKFEKKQVRIEKGKQSNGNKRQKQEEGEPVAVAEKPDQTID
jgi:hypothetical protein